MKTIYLIRHGKTAGNMEKRYVGSTDEPLCEAGIREINERREILLRSFLPENERAVMSQVETACASNWQPKRVYVSPMLRCRQTADLLFPDAEQEVVEDFREMDFGQFEYKNYEELVGDERYQAFIDSGGRLDFPDAEPQKQFRERVRNAFARSVIQERKWHVVGDENFRSDEQREPLVFVVHGGTIMSIMEAYARPHRDYFDWQVGAACGYRCVVGCEGDGFFLEHATKIDKMSHLYN